MDAEKFLILVNHEDKTKQILSYESLKLTVRVFYEES